MVLDAAETIVAAGGQIVVMGRGDPHFEHALQQAQTRRPGIHRGSDPFPGRRGPAAFSPAVISR